MKYLLIFFFPFICFGHVKFWEAVSKGELKTFNNKKILLAGELESFKNHIRARDNFTVIKIKDPKSDNFVEVRLYTIKRLKRVNKFDCKKGQYISLEGKFKVKTKKNKVGEMRIENTIESLSCFDQKKS